MTLSDDAIDWLQERAALMEYEGNLPRDQACKLAFERLPGDLAVSDILAELWPAE
jgi:hypothetical protein